MIRVLVVDDSTFVRRALKRVLEEDPRIRVVGEAGNGREALRLVEALDPNVVTMDVQMPDMDGYETLMAIMERFTRPVLMLSSHTRSGAEITLKCLEEGAFDFLDKSAYSTMDFHKLGREVCQKVKAAVASGTPWRAKRIEPMPAAVKKKLSDLEVGDLKEIKLIVIGASTGGPPVIQFLLSQLPVGYPIPLVIIQHMPRGFTHFFAQRLNSLCALEVKEATEGSLLEPSTVIIAPSGKHLRLAERRGRLAAHLSSHPVEAVHVPSIDESMRSAAVALGRGCVGILLSGMGSDGAEGLAALRAANALTVVQELTSCVVFGMPKAALRRGGVRVALNPQRLSDLLKRLGSFNLSRIR